MRVDKEVDESFGDGDQFWISDSPNKPYIGQIFTSIDAAFSYYSDHAGFCGFNVRRSTQRSRNGIVVSKYFVCSKAGSGESSSSSRDDYDDDVLSETSRISNINMEPVKKSRRTASAKCQCNAKLALKFVASKGYEVSCFIDKHNHPFAADFEKQFLRVNRTMTAMNRNFVFEVAASNTGPYRAHSILKELCGSYSAVGATAVDFKNWMRDIKVFIGKHDSDMILQKFEVKRETSDNSFFYEYQTNSDGHLTRLFWADIEGRRSYDVFGDVVSFDATYRTNK